MDRPPLLIFIHDLGGSPQTFEDQVAKLPPGIDAQCPWLTGLRPGGPQVPFSVDRAAGDLGLVVQTSGAQQVWLVGVGIGAAVALQLALDLPDQVTKLVLAGLPAKPSRAAIRAQRLATKLTPRGAFVARNVDKDRLLGALGQVETMPGEADLASVGAQVLQLPAPLSGDSASVAELYAFLTGAAGASGESAAVTSG